MHRAGRRRRGGRRPTRCPSGRWRRGRRRPPRGGRSGRGSRSTRTTRPRRRPVGSTERARAGPSASNSRSARQRPWSRMASRLAVQPGRPSRRRSRLTRPRPRRSTRLERVDDASISSAVVVSGGMSTITSPSGRISTPRSTQPADTRRPQRSPSAGGASSMPVISPQRRTSATAGERRDALGEQRRRAASARALHVGEHVPLVEQLEVAQGHRARRGRSRCRSARGRRSAPTGRARGTPRSTRSAGHGGRQRQVAAGDALADAQQVGPHAALLGGEQRAGAAEAGGHLVVDQQHVVLRGRPRPRRRRASAGHERHAGGALHERLEHDRGQLVGVVGDQRHGRRRPHRARRAPGARRTGKRSGSNTSVPKPPSPTESEPMVSPW